MNRPVDGMSKGRLSRRVIAFEATGFTMAAATCWITELFDPPFNLTQLAIETLAIAIVGILTIRWSFSTVQRVKYLEGFMVVCAACKSVKVDDKWVSIEHIMHEAPDLVISHGICPDCALKLYGVDFSTGSPR